MDDTDIELKRLLAEQRRDRAAKIAKKLEELEERKREELVARMNEDKIHFEQTIHAAKKARKQAIEFLKHSRRKHESRNTKKREKEEFEAKRTQSMNQLMQNVEKTKSDIRAINEKKGKKREKEEIMLKEQMAMISNQGGNPYEVLREKEEREKLKEKLGRAKRKQELKREEILKRLDFEQTRELKQRDIENEKKITQREYNKQVHSQIVKEQKLSEYIRSKTLAGTTIIDPLGREPQLFPSKLVDPGIRERQFATVSFYKTTKQQTQESPFDDYAFRKLDLRDSSDEEGDNKDLENQLDYPTTRSAPETARAVKELEKLQLRKLSTMERNTLQNAREKARNNITKKQIIGGKEFRGQPFIAAPAIVSFLDFELGKTYTCIVELTNGSFTFNTFKFLQLHDGIKDLFELTYPFPGRMSAGTTCNITIKFTPKTLQGIEDVIPFLAETGPFEVPIMCSPKRVEIEIEPTNRRIDFGDVVIAEELSKSLKIYNRGSLDTHFILRGPAVEFHSIVGDLTPDESLSGGIRVLSLSNIEGLIPQHSSVTIQINYAPTKATELETELFIQFDDENVGEIPLLITGRGKDVPIYVKKETVDMKCCCLNTLYRGSIEVFNRGTNAMRCEIKVPRCIRNHMEFVPALGFVQTYQPLPFQLKFKPLDSIYQDCPQYLHSDTGELVVPIQIVVPDQKMEVFFDVKAVVTSSKLFIDPSIIDFGDCSIDERVSVPITLRNEGILPLNFGFINLPPEIEVEPDDGFGCLLSNETRAMRILFSPKAAIDYYFKVLCRTDRNDTYVISCSAVGIQPPLRFSASNLKFASVAIGDGVSKVITLSNISKHTQAFRLVSPDDSFFKFNPISGSIKSGGSLDIEVKLEAPKCRKREEPTPVVEEITTQIASTKPTGKNGRRPESRLSNKSPKNTKTPKKKVEKEIIEPPPIEEPKKLTPDEERDIVYDNWEKSEINEAWSRHKIWDIPCMIRDYSHSCIYLQVHATVVLPSLLLECNGMEVDQIDFGDTPVRHCVSSVVRICNRSGNDTQLLFRHPSKGPESNNMSDDDCPFSIVAKSHRLRQSEYLEIEIKYKPLFPVEDKDYSVQILSTATNNATIHLKGSGKIAQFEIDIPLSVSPPFLDFEHVLLSTSSSSEEKQSTQRIILRNCSESVSIPFNIFIPPKLSHPLNKSGNSPFLAIPGSGILKPGESSEVSLLFRPDYSSDCFFTANCEIHYASMSEPRTIRMRSACWSPGVYVVFDDNPRATLQVAPPEPKRLPSAKKRPSSGKTTPSPIPPEVSTPKLLAPPRKPTVRETLGLFSQKDPFKFLYVPKSALFKSNNIRDRYEYTLDNTVVGQVHKFEFYVANSKTESERGEIECVMTEQSTGQGFKFLNSATPTTLKFALELGTKKPITIQFEPKEPPVLDMLRKNNLLVDLGQNDKELVGTQFKDHFFARCDMKCTIKDTSSSETKTFLVVLNSHVFVS